MADDPTVIPILLLGDPGVGKSTFIARLTQTHTEQAAHEPLPLHITLRNRRAYRLDFSSASSTSSLSPSLSSSSSYYNDKHHQPSIIILTYSISSPASLQSVQTHWAKLLQTLFLCAGNEGGGSGGGDRPVFLLGLKRDLRHQNQTAGAEYGHDDREQALAGEVVDPLRAYKIAQDLRCDAYLECSAVTGELISQVREDLCRKAVERARADEEGRGSWGGCVVV